ncbi:jg5602 [Pararge aegeria aegeria]|uniref:Jg5602 protein n=1 Tax=Pararge aegeria aegeria TaxID=348720 RepID=A0A8S4QLW1_9NEOP|nr:jg5602 [Pararge aegeria aegeria]
MRSIKSNRVATQQTAVAHEWDTAHRWRLAGYRGSRLSMGAAGLCSVTHRLRQLPMITDDYQSISKYYDKNSLVLNDSWRR